MMACVSQKQKPYQTILASPQGIHSYTLCKCYGHLLVIPYVFTGSGKAIVRSHGQQPSVHMIPESCGIYHADDYSNDDFALQLVGYLISRLPGVLQTYAIYFFSLLMEVKKVTLLCFLNNRQSLSHFVRRFSICVSSAEVNNVTLPFLQHFPLIDA